MRELIVVILLFTIPATCTVLIEKESTKRDAICKEFLLKCIKLKEKCSC